MQLPPSSNGSESSASANSAQYDLKTLKRMCGGDQSIRPLKSSHTGLYYAWEAYAGALEDPKTGELRKQRKQFNFGKYGSPQEALADAKTWVTDMRKVSNAEKGAVIALPMALRTSLLYLVELCEKEGVDVVEMCRLGLETVKAKKVSQAITFEQAAKLTLAQKQREDASPAYLKDLRDFYKDAGNSFNDELLHEISADEIEEWLEDQDVGPVTWNNYRRKFGVLLSFAANPRNGWVKENVIGQVIQKEVKTDEVTALTPAQAKTLLATATRQLPRLVPYLCVSMFAGLRRSEAERAVWDDIDWETESMRVSGGKMRSATSRYVHLQPVFIDWMKPLAAASGDQICTGRHARRADLKVLRGLTFDFDGNIFRHSFGTHHYRAFNNPQATIVEMGHTTPAMLFKHYRKPVPQTVAQKFWELTREVVMKEDPGVNGAAPQPG